MCECQRVLKGTLNNIVEFMFCLGNSTPNGSEDDAAVWSALMYFLEPTHDAPFNNVI